MTDGGIVYVLTNEAMPHYVKIGLTRGETIAARLKSLDNTSLPFPFVCFYSAKVPDCRKLERTLHFVFGEKRSRENREFFSIDPNLAKSIIELVALEETTPTEAEQPLTKPQREAVNEVRAKRAKRRTLESVGLRPGDKLEFSKDPTKTATVVSSTLVKLDSTGEQMSASAAALRLINEMGYDWPAVSGFLYWRFNGRLLSDLEQPENDDPLGNLFG